MTWLDEAEKDKNKEKLQSQDFQTALAPAKNVVERVKSVVNIFRFDNTFTDKCFRVTLIGATEIYTSKGERYSTCKTREIFIFHHSEINNSIEFSIEDKRQAFFKDDDDSGFWGSTSRDKDVKYKTTVPNNLFKKLTENDWTIILGWIVDKSTLSEANNFFR